MTLSAPQLLAAVHDLDGFTSGAAALDDWLKRRARVNQVTGASRTYVACKDRNVIGYYALASGAIQADYASGRFRRNMPEPIPAVLLARLAVDRAFQRHGLGRALFRDAALRVMNAAGVIGIRGLVVHALSTEAKAFYTALGLSPSPLDPMTLMVTVKELERALAGK